MDKTDNKLMSLQTLKSIFFRFDTIGFLICILFFVTWPQFDIYISHFLYNPENGGFYLKSSSIINTINSSVHALGVTTIVILLLMLITSWLFKKGSLTLRRKAIVYLLSVSILGPGLIVNVTLKNNWERPRPRQTVEFGGERTFEPAFAPTFQCEKCYSFVSGHAAVGFFFFAFALLSNNRRWLWLPAIAGGAIGFARMSLGAHFLSDIIFSGWVMWFCSLFLHTLFFKKERQVEVLTSS